MNIITLTGRLTRDPETRLAKNGGVYIPFTVAVERSDKNRTADFFDCIAFGSTADFIAKYFKKGDQIIIGGRLITRKVIDRGENRYRVAVSVESFEFGQKKKEETKEAVTSYRRNDIDTDPYIDDDQPW